MVKVNRRRPLKATAAARVDPTAFRQARAIEMSDDLARKYAIYVDKTKRKHLIGGFQTSGVDSGRKKVYDAENKICKQFPKTSQKLTKRSLTSFFRRVVKSKTYQQHVVLETGGQKSPALHFKKKNVKAAGSHASSRGVSIHPGQMDKYTVLHELAHAAGNMHHDLAFRKTLVRLVSRFLGSKVAVALKRSFKDEKVKMWMKTTIKTPEAWLCDYRRLEAMRARV